MKMRFILQRSVLRQQGALFVYKQFCYLIFLLLPVLHGQARAGNIPGAPVVVPLEVLGDFSFILSNNILVLTNRHEPDEYRNHQVGIQFDISPRWSMVFDNSVLTAGQLNTAAKYYAGRIDQLSLSLMYELYRTQSNPVHQAVIQLGTGFRSYGDFYGSDMHNGFHHLLKIGTDDYPYVDTAITVRFSSWQSGLNLTGTVSMIIDGYGRI